MSAFAERVTRVEERVSTVERAKTDHETRLRGLEEGKFKLSGALVAVTLVGSVLANLLPHILKLVAK